MFKKLFSNITFQIFSILVVSIGFFFFFQFRIPDFLGRDAYYHLKIAKIMGGGKLVFDGFPWLYFTTLRDTFVDQHFLFHLLLAPFLVFGNLISPFFKGGTEGDLILPLFKRGMEGDFLGAKIATAVFSSAAVLVFYLILKKNKIFGALVWTILLLGVSSGFIFRMNLVQAQGLAMMWFLLGFLALTKRKYFWLLPISFFYSWTHGGFVLILVMAVVWCFCKIIENWDLRIDWKLEIRNWKLKPLKPLILVLFGLVLGILFHPYFPEIISFLKLQLFETGPFAPIKVGAEWYPYQSKNLFLGSILVFIAFAASIFSLIKTRIFEKEWTENKNNTVAIFTLLILSTFFFVLTLRSQRFIEYWAPITVLLAAFVLSMDLARIYEYILKLKNLNRQAAIKLTTLSLFLILVIFSWVWTVYITQKSVKGSYSQEYAQTGEWLKSNTPKNSIVANLDWSDFPPLFYYNDQNYYISGLDQIFFYKYDKNLYQKYEDVIAGKNLDKAPEILQQDFKTNYVVINNKFGKLEERIKENGNFKQVYGNMYLRVYKIS